MAQSGGCHDKADGVPATRILRYGPDDFMPACAECAAFFEQTT